jgi:SAM-dependent methyltransferase
MSDLTDEQFWDDYWRAVQVPAEIDLAVPFNRCLDSFFAPHLSTLPAGSSIFEIGCAPGRWLAHFSKKYGLAAGGLDYSPLGVQKTRENLKALGVPVDVQQADFFKYESKTKYDAVYSLGFIEHFDDVDDVVRRHLRLVKDGGLLILGIPNFSGVYEPVQALYWQGCLDKHNLSIMRPGFFTELSARLGLGLLEQRYVGGFDPTLFVKPPELDLARNLAIRLPLVVLRHMRQPALFDRFNSPLYSSYIMAAMRKPKTK